MLGLKYIMFITQTQLKEVAAELKVTPQFVASWNKGTRRINNKYKEALASYFKIDKEYFAKELTLEDKINIELQLNGVTSLNKEQEELLEIANNIDILNTKYKQLLEKYTKLNNEHEKLKQNLIFR